MGEWVGVTLCLFTHAILDSCTMKTRMNCREIHNTMYGEIGSELHIIEIEGKGSYCHAILRVLSPFSMIMFCQRALVLFDQFRLDRALASQPGPSQLIELTINRPITSNTVTGNKNFFRPKLFRIICKA